MPGTFVIFDDDDEYEKFCENHNLPYHHTVELEYEQQPVDECVRPRIESGSDTVNNTSRLTEHNHLVETNKSHLRSSVKNKLASGREPSRKHSQKSPKRKTKVSKDSIEESSSNEPSDTSTLSNTNGRLSTNCTKVSLKRRHSEDTDDIPEAIHDFSNHVALDCEFVGCGPKGSRSALGRCSIVDYQGKVMLDIYAKPRDVITDYRTRYSGIRRSHLARAGSFPNAQEKIRNILKGKVVIGHALHNDFPVLKVDHPADDVRDTAAYVPLRAMAKFPTHQNASLKRLTASLRKKAIQTGKGGHCSVEDARSALELFKLVAVQWEDDILREQLSAPPNKKSRLHRESDDSD